MPPSMSPPLPHPARPTSLPAPLRPQTRLHPHPGPSLVLMPALPVLAKRPYGPRATTQAPAPVGRPHRIPSNWPPVWEAFPDPPASTPASAETQAGLARPTSVRLASPLPGSVGQPTPSVPLAAVDGSVALAHSFYRPTSAQPAAAHLANRTSPCRRSMRCSAAATACPSVPPPRASSSHFRTYTSPALRSLIPPGRQPRPCSPHPTSATASFSQRAQTTAATRWPVHRPLRSEPARPPDQSTRDLP